jgi:chemotaxis signal transduction protein
VSRNKTGKSYSASRDDRYQSRPVSRKRENKPDFLLQQLAMIAVSKDKMPFVLFESGGGLYGVSAEFVREMLMLPAVVHVPNLSPEIRGVINIRGSVLKLVDLRIKLGLASAKSDLDGLTQLLQDREQDHRNWLKELEACVREHRPFNLARDPHKCKFGLWYDHYQNQEKTIQATFFRAALKKMDEPHRIIHASADEVLKKAENGNFEEALAILEKRRNCELAALIKLFEDSRQILKETRREIVMVVKYGSKQFAMSVDSVQSVEHFPSENIEPTPAALTCLGKASCHIAQRAKTRQTVLLLGPDFLFSSGVVN